MTATLPILLDADGVLTDFARHTLTTVGSKLTPADVVEWSIFNVLKPEGLDRLAIQRMQDPAWWAAMPRMPGVEILIDMILSSRADVVVVTSPWLSCTGWETARREWIRALWRSRGAVLPEQVPEVIVGYRKDLVRGCVLVDDKPEHVAAWRRMNPSRCGYLFDAPCNQGHDLPRIVAPNGWTTDLAEMVIDRWRRQHEHHHAEP